MNVLITRPEMQAQRLAEDLLTRGDTGICLPTIKITPPRSFVSMQKTLKDLDVFDILIFVSPNTVAEFVKHVTAVRLLSCVLAIGKGTAESLQQHNINLTDYPQAANSSDLLALSALQQVTGKKIAIFAGENGKRLLADTLKKRGAKVSMAYTHRRCLPQYQLPFTWRVEQIDISVCTSLSSLYNFHIIIKQYELDKLLIKPLIVITGQMHMAARQLGFKSVIMVADDASNVAIMSALKKYEQQQTML